MEPQTYAFINWFQISLNICLFFVGIAIFRFLLSKIAERKTTFHSAYFMILAFDYFISILYTIANIYGKITSYSMDYPLMAGVYFYMWQVQSMNGIRDFIQGSNRSTAMAFPTFHNRIWKTKHVPIFILILIIFPFAVHPYVFFYFDCKFLGSNDSARCGPFHQFTNRTIALVNIGLSVSSLILIVFGIFKSRMLKNYAPLNPKVERRALLQAILQATTITILYTLSLFSYKFVTYDFQVTSYCAYLLKCYLPMFVFFFGTPTIRREFLRFYKLDRYFSPTINSNNAVQVFTMSTTNQK